MFLTACILTGCSQTEHPKIVSASVDDTGMTITAAVDSCNRSPELSIEETATTITVTATIQSSTFSDSDDCLDEASASIDDPLRDRQIIDGSTGKSVPLTSD